MARAPKALRDVEQWECWSSDRAVEVKARTRGEGVTSVIISSPEDCQELNESNTSWKEKPSSRQKLASASNAHVNGKKTTQMFCPTKFLNRNYIIISPQDCELSEPGS